MSDQDIFPESMGDAEGFEMGAANIPLPTIPFMPRASGLYARQMPIRPMPLPISPQRPGLEGDFDTAELDLDSAADDAEAILPYPWFQYEELRLDVDGRYPQMTVSGTIKHGIAVRMQWIAKLKATGPSSYKGAIWYKDGTATALPHTNVAINVVRSFFSNQRRVNVVFSGGGATQRVRSYNWRSWYFHPVELEFDCEVGVSATTAINTCAHPNRPAGITCENLKIETVFNRAGFDVRTTSGSGSVPISGSGTNATWSDAEMHDAMQMFWSRWSNTAKWSLWTFFARQHDMGPGLGGIMFDDIGPNHRQGTAIFNDSFISQAPAGDSNPPAWVRRMQFWTAVHEMGHAFNLAHSWQKALGTPWVPLPNEPEARSFMNYPYSVSGGQAAFFANFDYRFSNQELLFMRHAPERFVQMGNADWFDHHGFEQARYSPDPAFRLEARVHREVNGYHEFMEPVAIELKLKNVSTTPKVIDNNILGESDHLTVILKKSGKAARQWTPFARRCFEKAEVALAPGESLYGSVKISMGLNGWDVAEPGVYTVQVGLHLDEEDFVSNELRIRVAPPHNREEEILAQDYFSDEVGRVLAMDGSMYFDKANDVLREVAEKFEDTNAALTARLALSIPKAHGFKTLNLQADQLEMRREQKAIGEFKVVAAEAKSAHSEMSAVLVDEAQKAADTLGHINYKQCVDALSHYLAERGNVSAASKCQSGMHDLLQKRGVKKSVLADIAREKAQYVKSKPTAA